jgi:hypothetical protein
MSYAAENTLFAKNVAEEKYAEVDLYIKNFNKLIQLSRSSAANPGRVLETKELSSLSTENKKWLARELVKAPTSNIALSRLGDIVSLRHAGTGLVLARINVEGYHKTGKVTWDGKVFPVKEILQEESLAAQNRMLKKEIASHVESKKSFKQKVIENAFFVITLPLQLLSACTQGIQPGSEGALALASGHTMTPINSFIPSASASVRDFNPPMQICTGYNCSNGHQYNLDGSRRSP